MVEKRINPFVNELYVPYIEVIKHIQVKAGDEIVTDSYKIEAESYFRVYSSAQLRDMLYKRLTMWARDMFTAIQYFTNHDYRYTIITYTKIKELYGEYSPRRFQDTIKELVSHNLIDLKDRDNDQYWYNPKFFSPTNRIKLYEECAIKVTSRRAVNNRVKEML